MPGKVKSVEVEADEQPDAAAPTDLPTVLDELAIQIATQAVRKATDGLPLQPLDKQLKALQVAGAYWALRQKHDSNTKSGEEPGSAWGSLTDRLMNGSIGSDEEEEELSNGKAH